MSHTQIDSIVACSSIHPGISGKPKAQRPSSTSSVVAASHRLDAAQTLQTAQGRCQTRSHRLIDLATDHCQTVRVQPHINSSGLHLLARQLLPWLAHRQTTGEHVGSMRVDVELRGLSLRLVSASYALALRMDLLTELVHAGRDWELRH